MKMLTSGDGLFPWDIAIGVRIFCAFFDYFFIYNRLEIDENRSVLIR